MKQMSYLKNGQTLSFDAERCVGCGRCVEVCPHQVFAIEQRKARIAHREWCMECGACQKNCPASAIAVQAGVGCAAAIIQGYLKKTAPQCGCSTSSSGCCG